MGQEMKERHFLALTEGQKTIFVNLLQIVRAVIGLEDGKPICVLTMSDGQTINLTGTGQLSVYARLTELSIALNGEPLLPVDEHLALPPDAVDKPPLA
jgi:hypothetical protein